MNLFYLLPVVLVAGLLPSAFALEIGEEYWGYDYNNKRIGEKTYIWTSTPPKILVGSDWIPYKFFEDANVVILETNDSGSIVFDKNTCSYNLYHGGLVGGANQPKIKNISYTVKGKQSSSSTWGNVNGINNAACSVATSSTENTVSITGSKTTSAGTFQIQLDYKSGKGIKETLRAYNNNPAWNDHNIGFTETFEVPQFIKWGNGTINLANLNNTVYDRDWIENHEAKLIELTDKVIYDFGIGFDNLNDVKIIWDGTKAKLALNYLYPLAIVPYQQWIEVDPTFGYTAGTQYGPQGNLAIGLADTSCQHPNYSTNAGGIRLQLRNSASAAECGSQAFQWNISSIPDGASINNSTLRFDNTLSTSSKNIDVTQVTVDITTAAAIDLWQDVTGVTSNVDYVTGSGATNTTGTDKTISLGTTSASTFNQFVKNTALGQDRIAVGIWFTDDTRGATNYATDISNPELQIMYLLPQQTFQNKPNRADNSTAIGNGYVIRNNATNSETKTLNSTGWAAFTNTVSEAAYNYTVKDAIDNFVNNMTINKAIVTAQARQGPVNIYDVDCSPGVDNDIQVKINFTNYHNQTYWSKPTCNSDGDITMNVRWTKLGKGPSTNQTTKFIARILDTAEFTWLPGKLTVNGTTKTGTYLSGLVNFTGIQVGNGYNSVRQTFVLFTDNVTSAPQNLRVNSISSNSIQLFWQAPASNNGAAPYSYAVYRNGTLIQNSTGNVLTYTDNTLSSGNNYGYAVCAWNRMGCSPNTATGVNMTHTPTTGTITLVEGNVGDTVNINATITITDGAPAPFTVSNVYIYRNNSLVYTNTTDFDIAGIGRHYVDRLWYQITNDGLNIFHIRADVSNSTGTVTFSSSNTNVTREYDPVYLPADDDPATEGFVNYTIDRFDGEDGIHLQVNREGGTLGVIWTINCITQTNSEARSTVNQSLNWPGTWENRSGTGFFNGTWTGFRNTQGYVTCFNPPGQLFTTISYTNSSLALFGIDVFDESYGAMLGVPVGIFFLALAGGMANKRTAPTWIVVILGMAGIMATIGFFTFTPIVWGLALVTGLLGLLVNQKVF